MNARRPDLLAWLAVCLAAGIFALPLLANPGLPAGSDADFTAQSAQGFLDALREGVLYPRWIDAANRGFGAPTFVFYAPLAYYLTSLVALVSGETAAALRWTLILSAFLSGGAFFVAARAYASPLGAAAGACLYLLLPYHVLDVYDRFAYAEALAFIWFPLLFLYTSRVASGVRGAWLAMAFAYAGLLLTHLVTAYMALFALVPYGIFCALRNRAWRRIGTMAGAGVLALGLAAVFLLPVVVERDRVHLDCIAAASAGSGSESAGWCRNFDPARSFLYRDEVARGYRPAPIKPWVNRAAAAQGLVAGAAATLLLLQGLFGGVAAALGPTGGRRSLLSEAIAQSGLSIWTLFLQLPQSEALWGIVPGIGAVQFPWRFQAFQLLAAASLVACALTWLGLAARSSRAWLAGGLVLLLGVALPALETSRRVLERRPFVVDEARVLDPGVQGRVTFEYIPAGVKDWVRFRTLPLDRIPPAALAGPGRVEVEARGTHLRSFRVESPGVNALRLRTFAYPGWHATVGAQPVPLRAAGRLSQIEVDLPPGAHLVEFHFGGTRARSAGVALSLASLLLAGGLCALRRRRNSTR